MCNSRLVSLSRARYNKITVSKFNSGSFIQIISKALFGAETKTDSPFFVLVKCFLFGFHISFYQLLTEVILSLHFLDDRVFTLSYENKIGSLRVCGLTLLRFPVFLWKHAVCNPFPTLI